MLNSCLYILICSAREVLVLLILKRVNLKYRLSGLELVSSVGWLFLAVVVRLVLLLFSLIVKYEVYKPVVLNNIVMSSFAYDL